MENSVTEFFNGLAEGFGFAPSSVENTVDNTVDQPSNDATM